MAAGLTGLDDVPWHRLEHAYGSAEDVPALLRRVEFGASDGRVWEALFTSLAHQGTVYSASAAAVPFLLDLTEIVEEPDLAHVMELLEGIASGESNDPAIVRACVRAAQEGYDRYLEILADEGMASASDTSDENGPNLRAATARLLAQVVLNGDLSHADPADDRRHSMLAGIVDAQTGVAATAAAIALAKVHEPSSATAARQWCDLIVRDVAKSTFEERLADSRTVLRSLPRSIRSTFFDALLAGTTDPDRSRAFELGHAILWLAFHWRLSGPAARPPAVVIESAEFPMPCDLGVGPPEIVESVPAHVHWRDVTKRPPAIRHIAVPYVRRSDEPERLPHLPNGPMWNIATSIAAGQLTPDERRALDVLLVWDAFWETESDLLMVYGLPVERSRVAESMTAA